MFPMFLFFSAVLGAIGTLLFWPFVRIVAKDGENIFKRCAFCQCTSIVTSWIVFGAVLVPLSQLPPFHTLWDTPDPNTPVSPENSLKILLLIASIELTLVPC